MPVPRYRLVVLGSARVGKTSLIQQYLHTQFSEKYKETIEDMHSKRFRVKVSSVKVVLRKCQNVSYF
jgi:GTPase SAR1 family protein